MSSEHRRPLLFPDPDQAESTFLGDFFRRETVGGAIALLAAALAVVWANSPWGTSYADLRALEIGPLDVEHSSSPPSKNSSLHVQSSPEPPLSGSPWSGLVPVGCGEQK